MSASFVSRIISCGQKVASKYQRHVSVAQTSKSQKIVLIRVTGGRS